MGIKCNLIVDSCCDLPFSMVDVSGVELIEFPFVHDGEEKQDDLYRSLTPKEFYDAMRNKKKPSPTTAQVPANILEAAFRRACESGVPTVYLCFSSALSGSYDTALIVRDQVLSDYPDAELYVVDTMLASIAEGLLVLGAIDQRESGLSALEMVSWAEEARWFVNAQFMVDDLEALHRGGRVPTGIATAGAKLDVKPLLGFDLSGALSFSGVTRGRKKGIRSLAEFFRRKNDSAQIGQRIIIAHADAPGDANRLYEDLLKTEDGVLFTGSYIGPVIGSHVGPGMVAVAFWGPDRREDLGVADRIARRVKSKE
ncbi:MAG: DegV family protein [Eggerthellaceae bacterium]|nr:DegV family protein [Eggerthellaceae bacterium]